MFLNVYCFLFIWIWKCLPCTSIFLVIPEDVSTGLAAVYGFTPRFVTGNDHRLGFGFRFGNHADFQVMYELGPQIYTKQLQPIRVRSAAYRQRLVRRRPFLEFLIKTGLLDLKNEQFEFDIVTNNGFDEPR